MEKDTIAQETNQDFHLAFNGKTWISHILSMSFIWAIPIIFSVFLGINLNSIIKVQGENVVPDSQTISSWTALGIYSGMFSGSLACAMKLTPKVFNQYIINKTEILKKEIDFMALQKTPKTPNITPTPLPKTPSTPKTQPTPKTPNTPKIA